MALLPPLDTQVYLAMRFYPTLGALLGSILIPYFVGFWMGYRSGPTRIVFVPEVEKGSDGDDEPSPVGGTAHPTP